jgi:hypothetical protein
LRADSPTRPGSARSCARCTRRTSPRTADISDGRPPSRVCLACAGDDPAALIASAQAPESKGQLRAQTDEAIRLGIFGSPTFVVGDELFWGNDRLEDALGWARGD